MAVYAYIKTQSHGLDVIMNESGSLCIRSPDGTQSVEIPSDGVEKLKQILEWFSDIRKQGVITNGR